jgi:tellurite resistance protein
LTQQLLKFFANLLPGRTFDNIPAAVIRYLLDEERCEFIGVPTSRWESLFRSGWSGTVWASGKSLPLLGSKTVERLALALIEGHFREVGGVPVRLELQSDVRTEFQRSALSVIQAFETALADGQLGSEERATLAQLQTQLELSDTQLRRMAVVGAVNAALHDGVVLPAEIELINKFAEQAGMTQDQRAELATAMSDGVLGARERARLHEVLQIVG